MISFIITSFNKEKYIARSIRSCVNQLYSGNNEVIIVDDSSTDKSREIIEHFATTEGVKLIALDKNRGVGYASRTGVEAAAHDWIVRVDADDYISNKTALFFTEFIRAFPDVDYISCNLSKVTENGLPLAEIDRSDRDNLYEYGAGIALNRHRVLAIGNYDADLRNCEDRDLLVRLDKTNNGQANMHIPLSFYRYFDVGESLTGRADRETVKNQINRKHDIEKAKTDIEK